MQDVVKLVEERMNAAYWALWQQLETADMLRESESGHAEWTGDKYPTYGSVVKKESD